MHWLVSYSKGQMKVQEMSFVLIAIMIFFGIAALIFFKITLGNLSDEVIDQRSQESMEIVRKLSQTPEFSFTSFGDCPSCLDLDKAFSIKNVKGYNNFFNLEYIQFEVRYPNKTGECTKTSYPNCATVTLGNNTYSGDVKSAFVALCRVDYNLKPYKKCELGMIHAAGKSLDSFLGGIMAKNNKGQEEVVGFIAIVVIISIIGLIFLGLSVNSDEVNVKDSKDVSMFLSSALEYTSECEITLSRYLSLQDLIKECYSYSGNRCINGNEVCFELNRTLTGVLEGGYRKVGDDFQIKGYSFRASYSLNSSDSEETKIIGVSKGNCTGNIIVSGSEFFSTYPGIIYTKLSLCY